MGSHFYILKRLKYPRAKDIIEKHKCTFYLAILPLMGFVNTHSFGL